MAINTGVVLIAYEAGNGPSSPDEVTNMGLLSTLVGTSAFILSCDGDPGPPFVA